MNADQVVARFNSESYAASIDWDHSAEIKGPAGERNDAAGWIEELEARADGIWGRVSWTPEGARCVKERSYRYISPVFTHNQHYKIIDFIGAGLTHRPNLKLTAINSQDDADTPVLKQRSGRTDEDEPVLKQRSGRTDNKEDDMSQDFKGVTDALGLAESTAPDLIAKAVKKLKEEHKTAQNSAENVVPKADFEKAIEERDKLQAQIAEARKAEIETVVNSVIEAGRATPAQKDDLPGRGRAGAFPASLWL